MSAISSKSLIMLGIVLMVALALQAGAIKMLVSLQQPDTLNSARLAAALEAPPSKEAPRELPAEPLVEPVSPATPHPGVAQDPEAHSANPEAQALQALATSEAPPATAASSAAPEPVPAAAPTAHNPMLSNIPPPIQLDPEPVAKEPLPLPLPDSTGSPLATPVIEIAPPPAAAAGGLLEPDWLKGRDPKRYTVQLYSGKNMDKVREIATASAGIAPPAYFVTTSRSGPWYSLVVGDFADFNSAQDAATKLAAQPGATKPWIRRFSEIQSKMR